LDIGSDNDNSLERGEKGKWGRGTHRDIFQTTVKYHLGDPRRRREKGRKKEKKKRGSE